jgi:hypothetical protein
VKQAHLIWCSAKRLALYLFAGIIVYLALYGEPDLTMLWTWVVVATWPAVLLWHLFLYALLATVLFVVGTLIYVRTRCV